MTLAYVFIGVGIGWFGALVLTGYFGGQDDETERNFDYNENHEDKRSISSYNAHQACDRIQDLLQKCWFCIGDFIPPIKNTNEEFIYSVRTPEKPPFIARTNDPEVIKHIYELFIEIGGWQEAKFLLENLRLNIEK